MLSSDAAPPVDRPNLSKDYLAGNAPEDWVPLRPDGFYAENGIELRLNTEVSAIDAGAREVVARRRRARSPTTGCCWRPAPSRCGCRSRAPISRMSITLRSLADCRAIIDAPRRRVARVVIGASFIGLEVAAALRAREIEVHVVAPEQRPMERILGPRDGRFHPRPA